MCGILVTFIFLSVPSFISQLLQSKSGDWFVTGKVKINIFFWIYNYFLLLYNILQFWPVSCFQLSSVESFGEPWRAGVVISSSCLLKTKCTLGTGSIRDGVNFLHSSPHGAVFQICVSNNVLAVAEQFLHSTKAFSFSWSAHCPQWVGWCRQEFGQRQPGQLD